MADVDEISHSGGSRRGGSATCKPLLDAATPELFQANAFRITGLAVDATTREITKHADKLKTMEELGLGKSVHTGVLALKNPPTVDEIRGAIERLKDPERRIIDEFFWFWPKQFGQSGADPALKALATGDVGAALEIWRALETDPSDGLVAMHNVAVLWHLSAIDWENYAHEAELDEGQRREVEKYWRKAFKRWERLAANDVFWESVSGRIMQIADPRLTTGFVRRMRATLPHALDKINAELAVRYAENGRMDLAQVHVKFMQETNQGLDNIDKTAELVLAPATTRLRQQIQRAEQRAAKDPTDGVNAARELLDHARHTLALFELFFGKESDARNELSDEVAGVCHQLPIAYHKSTGDDKGCIDLLREALPFATSIDLRRRIEKNIGTLTGNLTFKQMEPVYAVLQAIQESKQLPSIRLHKFRVEAVSAILKVSPGIIGSQELHDLRDGAAGILRGISLTAWNEHEDLTTAVAANELALKYVCSAALRQRLSADQTTLRETAARRSAFQAAQQKPSKQSGTGCLVMLGIVGLLVLIGWFGSNKSSPTSSSTSSVSTPRYSAPSSPYTAPAKYTAASTLTTPKPYTAPVPYGTVDKDVYRVPQAKTAELDRDRQAVDAAKARAAQYSSQIETLAREIERDRASLNRSSQLAVDDFNRKVSRYNSMLEQGRLQDRAVNQLVDDYNTKLRRYGR